MSCILLPFSFALGFALIVLPFPYLHLTLHFFQDELTSNEGFFTMG